MKTSLYNKLDMKTRVSNQLHNDQVNVLKNVKLKSQVKLNIHLNTIYLP